jgi:hypothetical protein
MPRCGPRPPLSTSLERQARGGLSARRLNLALLLLVFLFHGCATHELVLSRTLRPALASEAINFSIEHFRARVGQSGDLEVWARVNRSVGEYRRDFDNEIQGAAALCVALAHFERTFSLDWSKLELNVTTGYGSQLLWKTGHSFTKVTMGRDVLLGLRKRNAPATAYPEHWHLFASKIGPPDYVYYEWSPGDTRKGSVNDGG